MATIITVHGTFAHMGGEPSEKAPPGVEPQWWQVGSAQEADLGRLIEADEGPVRIVRFLWSGDNSELERRKAGTDLLQRMLELEAAGEAYVVVGHSHGGSVISAALMEAASRGRELPGMKRWISVGTPFISLRKERTLFLRLPLLQKAVVVASLMLLLMLAAFVGGELASGNKGLADQGWLGRFGLYFLLMSLPFALFWSIFKYFDVRKLHFYRPRNIARASSAFGPRWLGLWHEDDEAVSGLSSIGGINVRIFHDTFAVSFFSMLSVFLLPVLYLLLLLSPGAMVSIAEFLRDDVYNISHYEKSEDEVKQARGKVRQLRRSLRQARQKRDNAESDNDFVGQTDADKRVKALREELRKARQDMHAENPNLVSVQRALRFKRKFLVDGGKPCAGGSLCGQGRDVALNSKLLFHIVTDEASSLVLDNDLWQGRAGLLVRMIIPVVLVPIVFVIVAILLVFLVQGIAGFLSAFLSRILDRLTWFEVKRSALGNDTETEVAVTAGSKPSWVKKPFATLPDEVGNQITGYSNEVAVHSLSKFRNAIGELALSEGVDNQGKDPFSYLTWRELVHSSYFEVPEFRLLIAEAIAVNEGFKRSAAYEGSSEAHTAAAWLAAIEAGRHR
ncbi:MAG: hypothetical protein K0U74_03825 [Alphaproteobacteria bacterium]|nr:hypothetical protein [Alphaproteobacteria bacterium]